MEKLENIIKSMLTLKNGCNYGEEAFDPPSKRAKKISERYKEYLA